MRELSFEHRVKLASAEAILVKNVLRINPDSPIEEKLGAFEEHVNTLLKDLRANNVSTVPFSKFSYNLQRMIKLTHAHYKHGVLSRKAQFMANNFELGVTSIGLHFTSPSKIKVTKEIEEHYVPIFTFHGPFPETSPAVKQAMFVRGDLFAIHQFLTKQPPDKSDIAPKDVSEINLRLAIARNFASAQRERAFKDITNQLH